VTSKKGYEVKCERGAKRNLEETANALQLHQGVVSWGVESRRRKRDEE
jgi:hypothetical protein